MNEKKIIKEALNRARKQKETPSYESGLFTELDLKKLGTRKVEKETINIRLTPLKFSIINILFFMAGLFLALGILAGR